MASLRLFLASFVSFYVVVPLTSAARHEGKSELIDVDASKVHGASELNLASVSNLSAREVGEAVLPVRPPQTTTTVTHKSWFDRMKSAMLSIIIGTLLVWFSIPCIWMNERRNAIMESLIKNGRAEYVTVEAEKVDPDLRGSLVHIPSAEARGVKPMQDERLKQVSCDRGCLRLRSTVEVFQWKEEAVRREQKDSVGGGETTVTNYSYTRRWLNCKQDSNCFHDRSYHNVLSVPGLEPGVREQTNPEVEYGSAFTLSEDLVDQLDDWQTETGSGLFSIQSVSIGDKAFHVGPDSCYYHPESRGPPQIGDMRVRIEYIPDGPATVLALQAEAESDSGGRDVFIPYRTVPRGLCGCSGPSSKELKALQIAEGRKTADELYDGDKCDLGPVAQLFCCCTCACNLVAYMFTAIAPPQIYHIFSGKVSVEECWSRVSGSNGMMKWGLRLVSWMMLFYGMYALFKPLEVMLDIVPFLGPYLGTGVAWMIWLLCFVVTLVVAFLIISMAYLRFHPFTAFMYLGAAALASGTMYYIGAVMQTKA
mmetsp:Transcript_27276/g.77766  ORF Transcript_27276/g.77766 Transcript_27276/m.77766 type:complete len:536 (-) Transcript_27276:67-1674(-)